MSTFTIPAAEETQETRGDLWTLSKRGDGAAREDLARQYMPLVKRIARRASRRIPHRIELDDLIAAGYVGLMSAIDAFEPERGVQFNTFCTYRVRGAIFDMVREMDWVPRGVRQREKKITRAAQRLGHKLSRRPSDDELADELGVNEKIFRKLCPDARPAAVVSLQAGGQDSDTSWSETIGDSRASTPLCELIRKEVVQLVRRLTKAEQVVVNRYYFEGVTMKQIGMELNLTESRVSQVHATLLGKLRAFMGEATTIPISAGRTQKVEHAPLRPMVRAA